MSRVEMWFEEHTEHLQVSCDSAGIVAALRAIEAHCIPLRQHVVRCIALDSTDVYLLAKESVQVLYESQLQRQVVQEQSEHLLARQSAGLAERYDMCYRLRA
jgi:hypothetical protein